MKHFWEMYKLVEWVDNHLTDCDLSDPKPSKDGRRYRIAGWDIRGKYVKESKKTDAEVRDLIESCREEQYFKTEKDNEDNDVLWFYINPAKGRRFLRKWGRIPTGYLKEVFKDNYLILSFLLGVVATLISIYLLSRGK